MHGCRRDHTGIQKMVRRDNGKLHIKMCEYNQYDLTGKLVVLD